MCRNSAVYGSLHFAKRIFEITVEIAVYEDL